MTIMLMMAIQDNFERPAFKKMITDIENGKINCAIKRFIKT